MRLRYSQVIASLASLARELASIDVDAVAAIAPLQYGVPQSPVAQQAKVVDAQVTA